MYNQMNIREELMTFARSAGICQEGYSLMRCYDTNELISYYLENPDWCIERGFPSIEYLKKKFSNIEDRGVFVGKTFNGEVFNNLQVCVFHDCKGTINVGMDYDRQVIPMLYFANGCEIKVGCKQANTPAIKVPLYIADGCNVTFADSEDCIFKSHHIKMILP